MELGGNLRIQVQHFKEWASSRSDGRQLYGEWETEYPAWDALYEAAMDLLRSSPCEWDSELKKILLYAIARDNEAELISDNLSYSQVDALTPQALVCDESDAKWQIAEQLGKYQLTPERKNFLYSLALDTNEYVRRRAMSVLTVQATGRAS